MAWDVLKYIGYFTIGGLVITTVVALEELGMPLLSRLAALFPVVTWVSYLLIGQLSGPQAVSEHAKFVLLGTIFSWIPYMLTIIYLAPKVGVTKSIIAAILVFTVIALIFSYVYLKFYTIS